MEVRHNANVLLLLIGYIYVVELSSKHKSKLFKGVYYIIILQKRQKVLLSCFRRVRD